jgi:hypothetical protein
VGKAGIGVQLTRKSNREVQELAFFALPPDEPRPSRSSKAAASSQSRADRGR